MVYDTYGDSNQDETYELYEQREDRNEQNRTNDRMAFFKRNKLLILVTLFGMFLLGVLTGFPVGFFISIGNSTDSGKLNQKLSYTIHSALTE